ncbi:patatin-like phospholipase family protein [Alteromonas antoniana]|uniref:patatin-like phospholipase family protein n=1 Tax=Alteromonas antoniana TaxID=2803813 RepID=UPI001C44A5FE|nr:patatin-like phospholipase family protein [Alteromonas antoniana]
MSESAYHVKQIVPIFSGGGTRLPAHIGILKALEELQLEFKTIVGVSGGSIIAALHSTGYSIDDMLKLALTTDFKQFTEFSLWRLVREGGLSSGDYFEQWMDDLLKSVTFADVDFSLHILATDVNGGGPVLFNRERTPDVKVSQAIRFSMSIPLIFSFKEFDEQLLVDGAILSEDALFEDWQKDGTPSVCFRLKSEPKKKPISKKKGFLLPQYISLLIRTFMTAVSREYVHAQYWHNTLVINTGILSAVDFSMSDQDKLTLFDTGYKTTLDFLPQKLARSRPERITA